MRAQYNFLKSLIPQNSDFDLGECVSSVSNIRENIIKMNRKIALSNIVSNSSIVVDKIITSSNEKNTVSKFAFLPKEIIPPIVSPRLIQQISRLFDLLYDNLYELAHSIIENVSVYYHVYSYTCSIPALFGYFSSNEFCSAAFEFYIKMIEISNPKSTPDFTFDYLLPYFASSVCFSYFESVITPFLTRFIPEKRFSGNPQKEAKKIIELYSNDISVLMINSAPLFPIYHSRLLKFMALKWGEHEVIHFLIGVVLRFFLSKFLDFTSHLDLESNKEKIIHFLLNDATTCQKIVASLTSQSIEYQIPDLFTNFNHLYKSYYLCITDIQILVSLFTYRTALPSSLQNLSYEDTDVNSLFWVRVFIKEHKTQTFSIEKCLIFGVKPPEIEINNDFERIYMKIRMLAKDAEIDPFAFILEEKKKREREQQNKARQISLNYGEEFDNYVLLKSIEILCEKAENFENLMTSLMYTKQIRTWKNTVAEYEHIVCSPFAIVQMTNKFALNVDQTFSKTEKTFVPKIIQRDQYITLIESNLSTILNGHLQEIRGLKSRWDELVSEERKKIDPLAIELPHRSSNAIFWDCVKQLNLLDNENLVSSFRILQRTLSRIIELKNIEKPSFPLFDVIFCLNESRCFPKLYLILNTFAMSSAIFRSFCTDAELYNWVTFEQMFHCFLLKDAKFQKCVLNLQSALSVSNSGC